MGHDITLNPYGGMMMDALLIYGEHQLDHKDKERLGRITQVLDKRLQRIFRDKALHVNLDKAFPAFDAACLKLFETLTLSNAFKIFGQDPDGHPESETHVRTFPREFQRAFNTLIESVLPKGKKLVLHKKSLYGFTLIPHIPRVKESLI